MYSILAATSVLFVHSGLKITFEEDISSLLPSDEMKSENSLAFENLKVKDKIIIQIIDDSKETDCTRLAGYSDELSDLLVGSAPEGCVENVLNCIDDDTKMLALDYAISHIPSFVDAGLYDEFDKRLSEYNISERMHRNRDVLMNDEDGSMSMAVCQDPAGLLDVMIPAGQGDRSSGLKIIDSHFFSADSTAAVIYLSPAARSEDSGNSDRIVAHIEDCIRSFEAAHPDAKVLFHGAPVQSVFNSRQIKKDLVFTIGVSLLLIIVFISVAFRNRSTIPLLVSPVIWGAFFALSCIYWIQGTISLMSMGLGAIVMGVALSYSLHVITHYKYVSQPEQVIKEQSTPVILGSLTTVGAFAGLVFTRSDLLRDFGMFASLTIAGTALFSLVFVPHFLRAERNRRSKKIFGMLDKINSYPYDRSTLLKTALVILCAICLCFSGKVGFDSDLRNIGYNEPKVQESREIYSEKMNGGHGAVYFASCSDDLDSALKTARTVAEYMESFKDEGKVASYSAVTDLFVDEDLQKERIEKWNSYWTDERKGEVCSLVRKYAAKEGLDPDMFYPFEDMLHTSYSPGDLYGSDVFTESLRENFIEDVAGQYMVMISAVVPERHRAEVNDAIDGMPGVIIADQYYYTHNLIEIINDDFNKVLGIASVFVFLVLLASFRNLPVTLVAFLPMSLSWYVVKGVMGMSGLEFNLINIVIATLVFGVGVDYSIFIIKGLLAQARGQGETLLNEHKTAICLSAAMLILVLGSLIFARHPAIHSIGFISLVGMITTILLSYVIQPALFRWLMKFKVIKKQICG